MGHRSQVRFDASKQAFYCRHRKVKTYLGKDYAAACKRFGEIVGHRPPSSVAPLSVSAAVVAFKREHPSKFLQERLACWQAFDAQQDRATRLAEINARTLKQFLAWQGSKGWSAKTIHHNFAAISRVLRWCHDREYIGRVPAVPKLPRPSIGHRDFTSADLAKLQTTLAGARMKHVRPLVLFLLSTGCRPSEAINLKWSDVDFGKGACELGRHKTAKATGRRRVIPLTPDARKVLEGLDRRHEHVFLSGQNAPYTRWGLRSIMAHHGLPSPQRLRHTFAQFQLERGVPPHVLAGILGHTSLRMIQVYAQVREPFVLATARSLQTQARDMLPGPPPDPTSAPKPSPRATSKPTPQKRASARRADRKAAGKRGASRSA